MHVSFHFLNVSYVPVPGHSSSIATHNIPTLVSGIAPSRYYRIVSMNGALN